MGHSTVTMQEKMTDWKQITARIRRARTSKDPAGQLSNPALEARRARFLWTPGLRRQESLR